MIAGGTPVAAHAATLACPPLTLAAIRFLVAGICLWFTARGLGYPLPFARVDRPRLWLLAALCVPLNQVGYLVGIYLAGAAHGGIAYALVPLLIYWVSLWFGQVSWTGRMTIASLLAFLGAGTVIAVTRSFNMQETTSLQMIIGDVLLLSAAFTWALFSVLSRPVIQKAGAVPTLTVVFLLGSLLQLPLVLVDGLWLELSTWRVEQLTNGGIIGILYIIFITAYLNYLLWYLVIARYDATKSSIITNSSFLITVLLEYLAGNLAWSPWVWFGSGLLLAGIILANRRPRTVSVAGRS
ncbi:MAG: DMT family transporter [Phycisphaerae bacterium]